MEKLPISTVVVSCNEGHLLKMCLPSLQFCKQIIVVDLESNDNTQRVAKKYHAEVWKHDKVAVVEIVHHWIQDKVDFDWILITDPDEVVSLSLQSQIIELFNGIDESVGAIRVPWIFYFGKKVLKGTPWGGIKTRILLIHRKRFTFYPYVHKGRILNEGFRNLTIKLNKDNVIKHYWMQGFFQLLKKHQRYLKVEGKTLYDCGNRTSITKIIYRPIKAFYFSFISKKGYADGLVGFLLSIFWAWYQTMCEIKLYNYSKELMNVKER